jgi:neutral ceramidase
MRLATFLAVAALSGCMQVHSSPPSPEPDRPADARLKAGFARVDITPPPGAVLFGYGPEGKRSIGYRQRLHARTMLLEDARGERVALVVTELGANSALVHRLVARRTIALGLGADRVYLIATHMHSGPSHYFGLAYDVLSGEIDYAGFDRAWAEELAERIAASIATAAQTMRPAVARWSVFPVWGVTFNRSYAAYQLNQPRWQPVVAPPAGLTPEQSAVDPAWLLLRIDTRAPNSTTYTPAGALSIFAIHGTGIPSANRHYDSDLHGLISKEVERALSPDSTDAHSRFVHLFANGSEGDVTAMPMRTRCALPTPGPSIDSTETLIAAASHDWTPIPQDSADACLTRSRLRMREVANAIVPRFLAEFRNSAPSDSLFSIARAFRTIRPGFEDGFCPIPRVGYPTLAGPVDGQTRYTLANLRYIREGITDDGIALNPWTICHRPKRIFVGAVGQEILQLAAPLPVDAQLAVLRLGDRILATLPAEVTTTSGGRMKDAIAARLGVTRANVAVIPVVNGYLNYLATREEYQAQRYEGSSTIYGPGSAVAFQNQIVDLASKLRAGEGSPGVQRDGVLTRSTLTRRVGWGAQDGPANPPRSVTHSSCNNDRAVVDWIDQWPGRVLRARYPLIEVQSRTVQGWQTVARDDDLDLEVTAVAPTSIGYGWTLTWHPQQMPPRIRILFTSRYALPEFSVELACS